MQEAYEGTIDGGDAAGREEVEARWASEQEGIARGVVDTDDVVWLMQPERDAKPDLKGGGGCGRGSGIGEEEEKAACDGGVAIASPTSTTNIATERLGPAEPPPVSPAAAAEAACNQEHGCRYRRPSARLRLVGGVDISFVKGSDENACATLVVLSFPSLETVYEAHERVTMPLPYISGFLAFREVQHLARLVDRLRSERPDLEPDVTFVDGNGRLHPRGAGLACHFGVMTGLRTVGIGKTFLHVDGLSKHGVREAR